MRRDLCEIIGSLQALPVLRSLCTSGAGLSVARFAEVIDVGLDLLILSRDWFDSAQHDDERGVPGLARHGEQLLAVARRRRCAAIVNTVATKTKLANGELEALRQWALAQGAWLNLTVPVPQGRWVDRRDVLLDELDWCRFERFLKRPGVRTDTMSVLGEPGCRAGSQKLTVSPYGKVFPCQLLPVPVGNVRVDSLSCIWRRIEQPARAYLRPGRRCPAGLPDADASMQVLRHALPDR